MLDQRRDLKRAAIFANLLMVGVWVYAAILRRVSEDAYYLSAQEDEYLEWGTVWAFLIAAVIGLVAAWQRRRAEGGFPWFLCGVSLFCFFVAMEEISWGQRLLGYRPPTYFLEKNFQQELNVHNVMSTGFRKLVLKGIILGYGLVLPALAQWSSVRRVLARLQVVPSPLALAPGFVATYVFYELYPWSLTGEWVELMLGFGFLFAALAACRPLARNSKFAGLAARPTLFVVTITAFVIGLGVIQAAISRQARSVQPAYLEAAHAELEALKRDFLSGEVKTRCNRHRRLYTFKEKYDQDYLLRGDFAGLTARGLPEERANFFLDPWNSPYWIRDRCKSDGSRRIVFIYSFGPNRRRESSKYEILGDDVGIIIYDGAKGRRLTSGSSQ